MPRVNRQTANERVSRPDNERGAEGAVEVGVTRFRARELEEAKDAVAREEPLEIQLGGASLAVVMRTPDCDEELALGFLVTERVITSVRDVGIENALVTGPRLEDAGRIPSGVLSGMMEALEPTQTLFARTGGLHAVGNYAEKSRTPAFKNAVISLAPFPSVAEGPDASAG